KNPSTMLRMVPLPGKCRGGCTPRGDSSAGDQRQASCHTTHNVFCSTFVLVPRFRTKSQWRDSPRRLSLDFLEEFLHLANHVLGRRRGNAEGHMVAIELGFLVALMVEPARGARRDQPVPPRPDGEVRDRRLLGDPRDR